MKPTVPSPPTLGVRSRVSQLPAPALDALALPDREELLGAILRHRDGLPAVLGAARGSVLEALQFPTAGVRGAEPDGESGRLNAVAARREPDDGPGCRTALERLSLGGLAQCRLQELDLRRGRGWSTFPTRTASIVAAAATPSSSAWRRLTQRRDGGAVRRSFGDLVTSMPGGRARKQRARKGRHRRWRRESLGSNRLGRAGNRKIPRTSDLRPAASSPTAGGASRSARTSGSTSTRA